MKREHYTAKKKQAAVDAFKSGLTAKQAAAKYGIRNTTSILKWARGEGLGPPGGGKRSAGGKKAKHKARVKRRANGHDVAAAAPAPVVLTPPADATPLTAQITTHPGDHNWSEIKLSGHVPTQIALQLLMLAQKQPH